MKHESLPLGKLFKVQENHQGEKIFKKLKTQELQDY